MPAPLKFAIGLALIAFPLLEIALLIRASRLLGLGPVALIVIITGIAGVAVVRRQGLQTFSRTLAEIHAGRGGLEPMLDGLLRVSGGVLLILPGLITDLLGLALLVPFVRQLVVKAGLPKFLASSLGETEIFERRFENARERQTYGDAPPSTVIIEGEYEHVEEPKNQPKPGAGPRTR